MFVLVHIWCSAQAAVTCAHLRIMGIVQIAILRRYWHTAAAGCMPSAHVAGTQQDACQLCTMRALPMPPWFAMFDPCWRGPQRCTSLLVTHQPHGTSFEVPDSRQT